MINILILSVGTRNKIVQYFKKALINENGEKTGKVIATDASKYSPAIYDADKFYTVPRIDEDGYFDQILDICKKENIRAVLSLIDPELNILADNKAKFDELGVTIIGSAKEQCDISLDKKKMYDWLVENNFNTAKTYTKKHEFYKDLELGKINFPVFVKPIKGSASISISKVTDKETIDLLFEKEDNLMIQEFLDGQELGVDVYIDLISEEIVSIFAKRKLIMRAGETDKAVSFKDENLFRLVKDFVKKFGYKGQIDIDIFDVNGKYYISEVNPRFGGGYPHAYECGVDHMKLIINNIKGNTNKENIGKYKENMSMMKYVELMVREV